MATLNVLDWQKNKVAVIEASDLVFDKAFRQDLLHSAVKWQLTKRRAGTHQSKTRSMVSGSAKKPFKQKGTGNARQGNRRSPLNEGGSVIHGPQPRSYEHKMSRKQRQAALAVAVSYLNREGRLFVVDGIESQSGKTKDFFQKLQAFGAKKAVLVSEVQNPMAARALKNIPGIKYMPTGGVNVYDLLKYDSLIISKEAVESLQQKCGVN